jgi:dTDP-4-amino-4,6-dideoxygalactose transaminase
MAERVPCIDLAAEYAEVGAAVEEAVQRVLRSGQYVLGPETRAFEQEMAARTDTRFAVGAGSGTEALELALWAVGVGSGDEVVTTAFTYFATVEAILLIGARPIFVDIEPDGFNLDPAKLEAAISPRTRAILPVHLFGRCADMERIGPIADARGIPVVEDAAQAIGASRGGRSAGAFGQAGCFSFYPTKNLGAAGDGGCVTTDSEEVAERLRLLGNHGQRVRDEHQVLGTTSRIDSIQAAVLRAKLPFLDGWTEARCRIAERYGAALRGVPGVSVPDTGSGEMPVWNQYTIRCRRAEEVRAALTEAGVAWRHFYPTPTYRQPALGELNLPEGTCPETERACAEVVSLPVYPTLALESVARIAEIVARVSSN